MTRGIAAGIVTFNPDIQRLTESLKALYRQVETIYIYDNGSINFSDIEVLSNKFGNTQLFFSESNKGIAYALNRIYEEAIKDSYKWLLTLDHDSIVPHNIVEEFTKCFGKFKDIGVICPFIFDKRRTVPLMTAHEEYESTNFCMTSGSLVNLEIWELIGRYDEWLFIDLVDDDFCAKLIVNGFKIIRVNKIKLNHELGHLTRSKYARLINKVADVSGIEFLRKLEYKREVNPLRLYYSIRNIIYLNHKYRDIDNHIFEKKNYWYIGLASIIRGENKLELIRSFVRGIVAGKRKIKVQ